ncbi:MAG: CCA tRNA nucleotidyltransferase, partial [Pseudomonadota bacterium]
AEDHLRILRLFRFFAWYGPERVGRPDADALRASARMKDELASLSAERVWKELRKLLAAPDPSKSLLWMRTTGVLNMVLPESEKWGIDAIHGLVEAERGQGWEPDPLLRLAAIVPLRVDEVAGMAKRLRMSNADRDALLDMAKLDAPSTDTSGAKWRERLYSADPKALERRLKLAAASAAARGDETAAGNFLEKLAAAQRFEKPDFPISGKDLQAAGVQAGPQMGETLKRLEAEWVASNFEMSTEDLLAGL